MFIESMAQHSATLKMLFCVKQDVLLLQHMIICALIDNRQLKPSRSIFFGHQLRREVRSEQEQGNISR